MGLGAARVSDSETDKLSLADARDRVAEARKKIKAGLDPLDERNKPVPVVALTPTLASWGTSTLPRWKDSGATKSTARNGARPWKIMPSRCE